MALPIGSPAPDFELKNQFGESVTLSQFVGKKAVVLMFYPLSFSGICTGELCELRDNMALFNDNNVELLGISVDSHFVQRKFAEQEKYEFNLLADFWPHGGVAQAYGVFVANKGIANRATFVIDINGNIAGEIITDPGQARDFAAYKAIIENL
jgi:peroxiredoxin